MTMKEEILFKAEIRRSKTIWAKIEGMERPLYKEAYRLTDAHGNEIPIAAVVPNTASETLIVPVSELDMYRVFFLELRQKDLKTHCSFDGWFREVYSHKELGAHIIEYEDKGVSRFFHRKKTVFRIFSPRADHVRLYLYKKRDDKEPYKEVDMICDEDGVWEAFFNKNLKGMYYDFTVHGPDEPGNHFYETIPVHITDPYARVSMDTWGKCRVWEKTKPAAPLKAGIPRMEDVIAYEVNVQDFTDLLPVAHNLKGTLPAMIKKGLKNSQGRKIGFDYLLDLGINVVHLMPVQEFLHYPDDIWQKSFKDDPYMIEQGISEENYQWGYRTTHAFAIEHRYRKKGSEPGAEREQFRDLVQAFHNEGIAVIIDIVPNHTAENIDGQYHFFNFNVLDKFYYYRTSDFEHIGDYGNEIKTENRPMVQRWLIDQCKHFIEEFGIDGFRIDLAGQLDKQTLKALKNAIGEDKILYGEPWIDSKDPEYEANPDWNWYKKDAPITFFQDNARDAFKGSVFGLHNKKTDRGYAGGNSKLREQVKMALTCTFPDEKTPLSGINYLDIHDNWALADQFALHDWDGRFGVDEDNFKIAALLLYTSLGPIVIHGGTEIMRSKGIAPLQEIVKETTDRVRIYFHGKNDTYNLRRANQFIWENVGKTKTDKDYYCDYRGMYEFFQGLNRFRLSEYGKVFRQSQPVPQDYYKWIEPENPHLLGYIVDNKVCVLINVDEKEHVFDSLMLPDGSWHLIANNSGINHLSGVKDEKLLMKMAGGLPHKLTLKAAGFKMWVRS
jgi:pullulanase